MKKFVVSLLLALPLAMMAQEVRTADADTTVYDVVEEQPEYPGGMNGMLTDVFGNLKYPPEALEKGLKGKVLVQFVIEKDGSITHVEVVKDEVGYGAAEEVLRIVKNMKKFAPGKLGGNPVRTKYILPVTFQLYDEDQPQKDSKKGSRRKSKK